jgi:hypothetical protein
VALTPRTIHQEAVDDNVYQSYIEFMLHCSMREAVMPTHTKPHDAHSPLQILTELAVEGTSSLVEAQRTLLSLAQQENDILLTGIKERVGGFMPGIAMTDMVRRSLETLIEMQQELLTNTSSQALHWLEAEQSKKGDPAHLVEFAREGVETFTRAQKKFLDVVAQETARAIGTRKADDKPVKKAELVKVAREAAEAFIEAQKRLLDVMGHQMNVNLDVATQAADFVSPSRLTPMAKMTGDGVREFWQREMALIESVMKPVKKAPHARAKHAKTVAG